MTNEYHFRQVQVFPELHFPNSRTCHSSLGIPQTWFGNHLNTFGFKFGEAVFRARLKLEVQGKFGRCIHRAFLPSQVTGRTSYPLKGVSSRLRGWHFPLGGGCLRYRVIINQKHGGLHGSN